MLFETKSAVRNTDVPKFVLVCHFYGVHGHFHPNCHKLKFKNSVFQSRICDDITPATSPNKLFQILLKNLSLLACERKLQDITSLGSSPTKPKTRAVWMRKDLLK